MMFEDLPGLVPAVSAALAVVAMACFLLEFQFTGLRDALWARLKHQARKPGG